MSKLNESCIMCAGVENLNTKMDVSLNDHKYAVSICTACEDDASPKRVREALGVRLESFKKLIDDAKALGVTLTLDQILGTDKKPTPAPAAAPAAPVAPPAPVRQAASMPENYLITTQEIPTPHVDTRVHSKDRDALPGVRIPSKVVGNTGTTTISVHKMSSHDMQERFRRQALRSMGGEDISQYKECTACGGQGTTGTKKDLAACKACDGTGHQKA